MSDPLARIEADTGKKKKLAAGKRKNRRPKVYKTEHEGNRTKGVSFNFDTWRRMLGGGKGKKRNQSPPKKSLQGPFGAE